MHKKTITALAISLIATTAQAEWSYLTSGDTDRFYIDYSTIKKTRHGVRAWMMQEYMGGRAILSSRDLVEFDCKEERSRILSTTKFAGPMATGALVVSYSGSGPWDYAAPGTVGEAKLQAVCKHK